MKLFMFLKKLIGKTNKEKFFISSIIPNFTPVNDEAMGLFIASCTCCGWIKPMQKLFPVYDKKTVWSSIDGDFIEDNVTELWCCDCIKNYK